MPGLLLAARARAWRLALGGISAGGGLLPVVVDLGGSFLVVAPSLVECVPLPFLRLAFFCGGFAGLCVFGR